ncbi:MAG: hypothetical protein HY830_05380 [Actinobacteria bacterium]|nr:hypothetical protein [Actinomycetota bacterium]
MDVDQEIRRLSATLAVRHPLFAPQTVERLVTRLFEEYADARVRTYLPVLVERAADAQLRDLDRDYAGERSPHAVSLRGADEAALSA